MKTAAAWLAWRSGLSPERAGQLVRLAKVRDRYPVLFAAFDRGEVAPFEHAGQPHLDVVLQHGVVTHRAVAVNHEQRQRIF